MDTMQSDEHNKDGTEKNSGGRAPGKTTLWVLLPGFLIFVAALVGGRYLYEQGVTNSGLIMQNHSLQSTIDQMRGQIATLSAKVNQIATPPPSPPSPESAHSTRPMASSNNSTQDRRMKQVQSQLAKQQKELKETQDQLAAAKSGLEGELGSTRTELNGSIAKTHDELVALEKRGERSYFEFDLAKSKSFQREGPIEVSLRKADAKHQSYDMMMLVNDHELAKKKVDLYEPVWLHEADQPEPVQVVANLIGKNHIHGYVSAPKYASPESASNAAQPSTDSNSGKVSTSSATSPSYSSSTPTSSPATSSQGQQTASE